MNKGQKLKHRRTMKALNAAKRMSTAVGPGGILVPTFKWATDLSSIRL